MSNLLKQIKENPDTRVALTDQATQEVLNQVSPICAFVKSRYDEARLARRPHELRWLAAYKNFRGVNDGTTTYISTEISKAFIKITKTKTLAAYGQLIEVLFSHGKVPVEIQSSEEPLGAPEYAHIDPNDPVGEGDAAADENMPEEPILGYHGDGKDLPPGATYSGTVIDWIKGKFGELVKLKKGAGNAPDRIVFQPAKEAAEKMNKRVHDQFQDMKAVPMFRKAIMELCMLGSGVIKGPFNKTVQYPDWDEQGVFKPITDVSPMLRAVPIWNIYLDPVASTQEDLEYIIQRHKLSQTQVVDLKNLDTFREDAIDALLADNYNYMDEDFELVLNENQNQVSTSRYEVLEFWGRLSKKDIDNSGIDLGFEIPEDMDLIDVNAWISGSHILRLVINPLTPTRLPYYICPYEYSPYSPWGVGVPENMDDTQALMNGFMRLAVDNAVLSGSIMLEVDESVLAPGQDYKVETGKVFRKSGGVPNQRGVQSITIQNTSQQNMQMFDAARRLADESTGIPSFSHGLTGVQGVGRTAGGISMLMNAASQTSKTVVKNCDDYWFEPIGQWMYYWNMQHKFDPKLRGDLSAIAKGTDSLIQKEIMAQRLTQFAQVAFPNPALAPWINSKGWLKKFAKSLEFDVEEIMNSPDEAKIQAMIMQAAGGVNGGGTPAAPGQQGPALPGQEGFTGNNLGGVPPQGTANGTAGPTPLPTTPGASAQQAGAGQSPGG